jgi:hypothetical protein
MTSNANFFADYLFVKGCSRSSFVQLVLHFVSQQIRKCHQHHNVIQNESSKDNSFSNSQLYLTTKDPSEHERNTTLVC